MRRVINDDERELLKFNYEKIHESVWENHKISWTVSAIFLTAIFGFQTFIIKDYFSAEEKIWTQVLIAVLIIEGLVLIWFLVMQCFRSYNLTRFYRLRQIEEILSSNMICEGTYLMRQYKYYYKCFPKPSKKEVYEKCEESILDEKHGIKQTSPSSRGFDFFDIYKFIFFIISFLNCILILASYAYKS